MDHPFELSHHELVFFCSQCNKRLTSVLQQVLTFDICNPNEHLIKGTYFTSVEDENAIIIHLDEGLGLIDHPEKSRFAGCCGPSPEGESNKICAQCHTEIGRATYDCITPHYISLCQDKVKMVHTHLAYYKKLDGLKKGGMESNKIIGIETLLKFGNEYDARKLLQQELDKMRKSNF